MRRNCYTYAYLREGVPYYIGKGTGNRINTHHACGLPPKEDRIYLKRNLTVEEAKRHERYLIAVIGRKVKRLGPLENLNPGGGGPIEGVKQGKRGPRSAETRAKISAGLKGNNNNPTGKRTETVEGRARQTAAMKGNNFFKGRKHSPETKEKIRQSLLKRKNKSI